MTQTQIERHYERLEREMIWLQAEMTILWAEAFLQTPQAKRAIAQAKFKDME